MERATNMRFKRFLSRFGDHHAIRRRDNDDEETDRLRNEGGGSYEIIGQELCARYFEDDGEKTIMTGGVRMQETPLIMFTADADVQEGDRVYYTESQKYQLQKVTRRENYTVATTKLVN